MQVAAWGRRGAGVPLERMRSRCRLRALQLRCGRGVERVSPKPQLISPAGRPFWACVSVPVLLWLATCFSSMREALHLHSACTEGVDGTENRRRTAYSCTCGRQDFTGCALHYERAHCGLCRSGTFPYWALGLSPTAIRDLQVLD